jgi:UDP-N-acetylmuramoyl-L-alanyl-D-glutamate--2,6-diaminopimelate ligase
MQLSKALANVATTDLTLDISGVALNSNLVRENYIFVAISGGTKHGNDFILDAIKNGACLVLTDIKLETQDIVPVIVIPDLKVKLDLLANNIYPLAKNQQILAITGTNGKTSIAHFLSQTLTKLGKKTLNIGTLSHSLTTPDIFSLYHELHNFDGDCVILEVSSHALIQGRTKGLEFMVAIWSNLSQDHLDYHQTIESYLQAKLLITQQAKYGIFNADDESYPHFAAKLPHDSYSLSELDFTAKDFGFLLNIDNIIFELNLLGKFNLSNILATYKTLLHLGFTKLEVLEQFATLNSPLGRMQKTPNFDIFIDFAHTPDGLQNALTTLREHIKNKDITLVFGCGGERDKTKRALMGKVANDLVDRIILTSDNPRGESPQVIIDDIILGINKEYEVIIDRKLAIIASLEDRTNNIILIAGKGHENYQIIDNERLIFNDMQVVLDLL